jgi:hypothetical protein
MINNVYDWTVKRSYEYMIDDSHNHIHSREVLYHFLELKENTKFFDNFDEKKYQCAILGCLLHDMMDKKYMDENKGLYDIINFLKNEKVDNDIIDSLSTFLPTVSYSKTVITKENKLELSVPTKIKNHEFYQCFEAIRVSDLISSYNLQRTLMYQLKKKQGTVFEIFDYLEYLYNIRMDKLIQFTILPEWSLEYATPFYKNSKSILEQTKNNLYPEISFQELYNKCFIYEIPEWNDIIKRI